MKPQWRCATCGANYTFRYTPGVLLAVPTRMPDGGCTALLAGITPCGGQILPHNDAARRVETKVADNAQEYGEFINRAGGEL